MSGKDFHRSAGTAGLWVFFFLILLTHSLAHTEAARAEDQEMGPPPGMTRVQPPGPRGARPAYRGAFLEADPVPQPSLSRSVVDPPKAPELPGNTITSCGQAPNCSPLTSQMTQLQKTLGSAPAPGMKSSEELDAYLAANAKEIMAGPEEMLKYRKWIRAAADAFGIPEAALFCNLAKETSFKHNAISRTRARGLGQFTEGSREEASGIISGKIRVPEALGLREAWEDYWKKVNPSAHVPQAFTPEMTFRPMDAIGAAALWYRYTFNKIEGWTRTPPDLASYTLTAGAYNRGRGAPALYCAARSYYRNPEACIATGLDSSSAEGVLHMRGVEACMTQGDLTWVQKATLGKRGGR